MFRTISFEMSRHCQTDNYERMLKIDREIGFGEIICTTIYRGCRNCLTSTGMLLILDLNKDFLITAYPARWKIAVKMFYESYGYPPSKEYSEIIYRAKRWDCMNDWL